MKFLLALTILLLASPLFAHDTNWGGHSFRGGYGSRSRTYESNEFSRSPNWNNYRAPYRPNWGGYRPYYRPYPNQNNGFYFRFNF